MNSGCLPLEWFGEAFPAVRSTSPTDNTQGGCGRLVLLWEYPQRHCTQAFPETLLEIQQWMPGVLLT